MMAVTNTSGRYNAIVFSNYDRQRFENEYLKKLERFGVNVVRVISPDRGSMPESLDGIDTIIALVGMMSHAQYGAVKKWAKLHDKRFVHLDKHASSWEETFGPPNSPALALVPPPRSSEPMPTWVDPQMTIEAVPIEIPEPEVNETEELAKLYAVENAELRIKLAEATRTSVDPADLEQLARTRQKNAAALAVKTKMVNRLETENVRLQEAIESLRDRGLEVQPGDPQELERFTAQSAALELELSIKRRTMGEWELRMKQMVEDKKSTDLELLQAKEKIALLTRQQGTPREIIKEVIKEVVVNQGAENILRLVSSLQTMIDEEMMTPEEAFKKLSNKYRP